MTTVRINTSDADWVKRHNLEDIPYGTDVRGVMFFAANVNVNDVEHVTFAGADMIRFDLGSDRPLDHPRWALYPAAYLHG